MAVEQVVAAAGDAHMAALIAAAQVQQRISVRAVLEPIRIEVRLAIQHGMRIAFPMVLLSTREFGDWTRYLPRNPGFM